jgi:CDGSH-type Zn-finger protein
VSDFEHARVQPCPDGPLLLRGDFDVIDGKGVAHPTTRPVSAVCRCGATALAPWCDGTHKLLRDRLGAGPGKRAVTE